MTRENLVQCLAECEGGEEKKGNSLGARTLHCCYMDSTASPWPVVDFHGQCYNVRAERLSWRLKRTQPSLSLKVEYNVR
jgi:hypothetical protein